MMNEKKKVIASERVKQLKTDKIRQSASQDLLIDKLAQASTIIPIKKIIKDKNTSSTAALFSNPLSPVASISQRTVLLTERD